MKNRPFFNLTPIFTISLITLLTITPFKIYSQEQTKEETSENNTENGKEKTAAPASIRPYSDIITSKAISQKGLFGVHQIGDKYFFEIPKNLLGREVLLVVRTVKTGGGAGYGGESLSETLFRWDISANGRKIYLRSPYIYNIADKESDIYAAFQNSFVEPIFYAFDIRAFGKDSAAVIDVTDLYAKDAITFGLAEMKKSSFGIGNQEDNKSFIHYIKAFPQNIECRSQKTYKKAGKSRSSVETNGFVTFEINHSMLLLPEKPMMPRIADDRVGMFTQGQTDYSYEYFKIKGTQYVRRWRLEPKDTDAYNRGELTEPVKPIIFYIDPATPKKLVKYFKQGIEDWQPAFEAAGFKNAIIAKEVPSKEEDPDWDEMDARYSMVNYLASQEQNAYGPHVADPRSGEIIEAHVCIYHNLMKLVSNWYRVQTAGSNTKARTLTLSDEIMGELYRQVVCHEVGHSLGLPHNFAASAAIPVDSLRSKTYTDKYGTTMSIMDYARYNYIAQEGDGVERYIPVVGPYDKYNINWAYRVIPGISNPREEIPYLDKMIEEKLGDRTYLYIKHQLTQNDPRGQSEDLGDDSMLAGELGLKNLKYVAQNFDKWIYEPHETHAPIKEFYEEIFSQWRRYMRHVTTHIGGRYETYKKQSQEGPSYLPVERENQKRAMKFITENVFEMPQWLIRRDLIEKFDASGMYERNIRSVQTGVLNDLLSMAALSRMVDAAYNYENTYRAEELLEDIRKGIFKPVYNGKPLDVNLRSLHKVYIDKLKSLAPKSIMTEKRAMGVNMLYLNDLQSIVWNELEILRKDLVSAAKKYKKGSIDRAHLELQLQNVNAIINSVKTTGAGNEA